MTKFLLIAIIVGLISSAEGFLLDTIGQLDHFLHLHNLGILDTSLVSGFQLSNSDAVASTIPGTVESVDLLSIAADPGEIVNKAFDSVLNANPKLKLSTSEFVMDYYNTALIPKFKEAASAAGVLDLVENPGKTVNTAFDSYLEANPKLKLSTSEFVMDYYNTVVVPKTKETADFLAVSPLAKDTDSFINNLKTGVDRYQQVLDLSPGKTGKYYSATDAVRDLKNAFLANLQSSASGTSGNVGQSIASAFDSYLEANPKLKLSTSEFLSDYFQNEFLPSYQANAAIVANSPLGRGVQNLFSQPTSAIVSQFSDGVTSQLDGFPKLDPLAPFRVVVEDFLKENPDLQLSTSEYLAKLTESASAALAESSERTAAAMASAGDGASQGNLGTAGAAFTVPELTLPPLELTLPSVNLPTESIDQIIAEVGPALDRAGSTLGSELSEAGEKLTTSTTTFATGFSSTVNDIATDLTTVVPARTAELLAESQSKLSDTDTQVATVVGTASSKVDALVATLQGTWDSARQYKLFPDDSHWETGYWEQQIKGISKLTNDLQDDALRDQYISNVGSTLSAAGDRFGAQFNAKTAEYKDFNDKVVLASQKAAELSSKAVEATSKALEELPAQSEAAVKASQGLLDQAASKVADLQK